MGAADPRTTELVRRARRGDRDAYGRLVDRYRDMVYGLAYHLTGHFEDARDLTQSAFLQAYSRLPQLREPERFPSWLRRITVNLHGSQTRAGRLRTVPLEQADAQAVDPAGSREVGLTVRQALMSLREPDRLALTLHYIDGYTHAEIGGFLDTTASVVKARVARARGRLRREMLEMVGASMSEHKLPASLRDDIIGGMDALVKDLRGALPPDPDEVARRVNHRRVDKWREVLAALPDELQELKPQGEAPRVPVPELPEAVQEAAREAMYLTWLDGIVSKLNPAPWIVDPSCLWVKFEESEGYGPSVAFSNVPGNSGWIHSGLKLGPGSKARSAEAPPSAGSRDVTQLLESLTADVADVVGATDAVRARLIAIIPADAGELAAEAYSEMVARAQAAREHFTPEQESKMGEGERVSVTEVSEEAQKLLQEGMSYYWAWGICSSLASRPSWLVEPEKAELEFGLYPDWEQLGEAAGRPYVIVARGCESWQRRMWVPCRQVTPARCSPAPADRP